ncbi:MAG TPA: PEP-CTERM sorting domain-containing protein [Phycisphaerae bacterium]|nr:PEP-CTERM sorting domain-containing protein [Phycisphaerae bacterium]
MKKERLLLWAAMAVLVGGMPAFGAASLWSIGVLDPNTPYSEPRAVSQDGTYVVGTSTAPGGIRVPVVWSVSDGLVALPNPSGANSIGIGVSVGIGSNTGNIIIAGLHEGNLTQRYYKAPLNNLASGTWADCAQAGGLPLSDMRGGSYNDLRSDPGAGDGRWYTSGKQASNGRHARLRGDPFNGWNGSTVNNVTSVSAYGVSVGRSSDSPSAAYVEGPAFAFTRVPGSTGYRADGIGISSSFGKATDYDLQWVSGQVLNYNGTNAQAFRWKRGDLSMEFLGTLPGHVSSCAYTVADNGVTAGRSYVAGGETAVVWDTSGTWDTTGQAKSVKDLLTAAGVDTSMWSSLVRVYAASDDGKTLAGIGIWAADSSTRGFVATIPEPATLLLLALGGGALLRRRA